MSLILEIEYLSGVSFAAIGPDSDAPDWPPQPDRIFSAFVASWAARGQKEEECRALEWLEELPAPHVLASDAESRTTATAYVPPNDYETPNGELGKLKWFRDFLSRGIAPPEKGGHKKLWLQAWNVMPNQRKRSGLKERSFPAARPHDPIVRLLWPEAEPDEATLSALQFIARDTAYVGHSTSLTRCHFLIDDSAFGAGDGKPPRRRVYPGRFEELRRGFDAGRRPLPGASVAPTPKSEPERNNIFGDRWLILEHVAGDMPDIRACAIVARALRDALLSGYQRIGLGNEIPEVVSGHAADGSSTCAAHLAFIPLAFAGFPYADGHMMGFALVPPKDSTILEDATFRKVLRRIAPIDEERGRRVLTLASADSAFSVQLSPTFEAPVGKRSLDPTLYMRPAQIFATVTPIALDRHLKQKGEARLEEVATQIARCCRNIGLPEPDAVGPDKHSAIEGAPSAYPSGKSPAWTNWRLPRSLASRQITHAVIRFAEPVEGPVILGAGRFVGLGLCRPLDNETR